MLDVCCGRGEASSSLLRPGDRARIAGVDAVPGRVQRARDCGVAALVADARSLPFDAGRFDLALLFTALTSLPSPDDRGLVVREVLRVIRRGGVVLIYDYRRFPGRTIGLARGEIERLFPGCTHVSRRVTPAPPLVRGAASVSPSLAGVLRRFPVLRTHDLHAVRKDED